ncbi:hypothetical protein [Psychrobacter sp. I-STPA10]|uniref:hypothetical protein n=1 Tax=Psychrobacter sp. I-STPA10 TaxID=2585769 RepID=UPI001E2F09A2|nr:hypothetical protein [Psychrobacter sp. I-STPA10]
MESLSLASLSLASILASVSAGTDNEPVSQSVIETHISPAIAGSWVLQLPTPSQSAPSSQHTQLSEGDLLGVDINQAQSVVSEVITITPTKTPSQAECKEAYTFAADNIMWSVSGAEWTYGRYVLSHQEEGLPLIAINTLYDNNEVDCSGNQVDQTGEMMLAFVDYQSDEPYMYWCADKEGKDCFMTFKKQLP